MTWVFRMMIFKNIKNSTSFNAAIDEAFKVTFEEMGYTFERKGMVKKINTSAKKSATVKEGLL